jgi:hypothetical protein
VRSPVRRRRIKEMKSARRTTRASITIREMTARLIV